MQRYVLKTCTHVLLSIIYPRCRVINVSIKRCPGDTVGLMLKARWSK